jgi:membrane protease YdiL (CAAX protease family)
MSDKRRIPAILRGHLFLYDRREGPAYSAATGLGLLAIFVLLEYVVGPRAHLLKWLGVATPPSWERVAALAVIAILAALIAGARPRDIGLIAPGKWTPTEVLYLGQILVIASGIYIAIHFAAVRAQSAAALELLAAAIATEILWGFYQELIYRGLLQSELVRRFGAVAGIVVANIAFTFGPLHFYEWSGTAPLQSKLIFFAATFAIGLLFGYIFLRTRNILFIGIIHGVGDGFANTAHLLS